MQGVINFDTDLFMPIISRQRYCGVQYKKDQKTISPQMVADHTRPSLYACRRDPPSSEGRGYVLRAYPAPGGPLRPLMDLRNLS
jgi:alanyl-tRNA synthetase